MKNCKILFTVVLIIVTASLSQSRTVDFAGYNWDVKNQFWGPGPNYFSDRVEDIWVDDDGMHLTISERDGKWYCTETILDANLGYGTYLVHTRGRVDIIDPNMILGIFTWDTGAPQFNYREWDFEFARWGDGGDPTNTQYIVQPDDPGHRVRYTVNLTDQDSDLTLIADWQVDKMYFATYHGHHYLDSLPAEDLINSWGFDDASGIPPAGNENLRFNFWLFRGEAPQSGQGDEMLFSDFVYYVPGTFSSPTPTPVLTPTPNGNNSEVILDWDTKSPSGYWQFGYGAASSVTTTSEGIAGSNGCSVYIPSFDRGWGCGIQFYLQQPVDISNCEFLSFWIKSDNPLTPFDTAIEVLYDSVKYSPKSLPEQAVCGGNLVAIPIDGTNYTEFKIATDAFGDESNGCANTKLSLIDTIQIVFYDTQPSGTVTGPEIFLIDNVIAQTIPNTCTMWTLY